ncbi:MAG: RHS repeat-associated core domain-containing protein, partial [Bacteroidota bacterium]
SPLTTTARFNGNISGLRWYNANVVSDPRLGYALFYDNASRLNNAQTYTYSGSWNPSNKYKEPMVTYDANGNILTYQRYGHDGNSMDNLTYRYIGNTNKIDSLDETVVASSYATDIDNQPPGNYKYDANGNMQQDTQRDIGFIIYDINNQPVSTYRKSSGLLYVSSYDVTGNRIRNDENGTEYYVVGPGGQTEAIVNSNGSSAIHNTKGNDVIGQVKRNNTTWSRYYYLKDHLGSIRVIVNSSGAVDGYKDYYPFGMVMEQRSGDGSADTRLQFTGHEKDPQSDKHHAGAREYHEKSARWMQIDPLADNIPAWSPYQYVKNNPIYFVDPKGTEEYPNDFIGPLNQGDWRVNDRIFATEVWLKANWFNLMNYRASEYKTVEQRTDFYWWADAKRIELRHQVQWMGWAAIVSGMLEKLKSFSEELARFTNSGNLLIFDDMFPRIRELFIGDRVSGSAARAWDEASLTREQALVDFLYDDLSPGAHAFLWVSVRLQGSLSFRFEGDLRSWNDRMKYGLHTVGPYYERTYSGGNNAARNTRR